MSKPTAIEDLRELVRLLEMRDASFSCDYGEMPDRHSASEFIVNRTKLWRETWVLPRLRRLLEREEKRLQARRRRNAAR